MEQQVKGREFDALLNPAELITEFKFPSLLQKPAKTFVAPKLTSTANAIARTYGWDTAFAIRMPDANAAIIAQSSSPKTFSQKAPDGSCSVNGDFEDWQISGGAGIDIHFSTPIKTGSLNYNGKQYSLEGAEVHIEVQLNYLPSKETNSKQTAMSKQSSNGNNVDLVTRFKAPENEQVVSVINFTAPNISDFVANALAASTLQLWFNSNLTLFTHVFSAVNLNTKVDKKQFQWLAPTSTSYAFCAGSTANDSILGVLCMTENRSSAGIASQLSPNAIPKGARSGFLISQERFLTEMVLPGLPSAFPGSTQSDFALSDDKSSVINTTNIKTKTVEHAGTTYHPEVTSLEVSINENEIVVHSITRVDIALGTYAEITVTSYQNIEIADKPDGSQTLVYKESRPPIKDHTTKTTTSGVAQKIILELALIIIGVILTIVTEGAFLVVALIIIALLIGLIDATPTLIADAVGNKVSNDSPSLALLTLNCTSPTCWPGGNTFKLTFAGMNDSLQLGGNPGFI